MIVLLFILAFWASRVVTGVVMVTVTVCRFRRRMVSTIAKAVVVP